MIRKLLVAVDGSPHSVKALRFAEGLCEVYGASMTVVNVRTRDLSSEAAYLASEKDFVIDELDLSKVAEKVGLNILGKSIRESEIVFNPTLKILFGDVAESIVKFAEKENVDTIVMGSRGLSDLAGVLLGSVFYKVTSLAHCSCINVKC